MTGAIPRLSTIKEDSPEFGPPATENSDMVNHRSMQGKENKPVAYHFNQYLKQNVSVKQEQLRKNTSSSLNKQKAKIIKSSKSPPLNAANQIQHL